jgi:hypothetical protein
VSVNAQSDLRIDSITPDSASVGETVEIWIEGEGFEKGTMAYLRNPVATLNLVFFETEFFSPNNISATFEIPMNELLYGQYNLTVWNTYEEEYMLVNGFTVTPPDDDAPDAPLRIDSVSPNSSRQGEVIEVEVFGDGFVEGSRVRFKSRSEYVTIYTEESTVSTTLLRVTTFGKIYHLGSWNVIVTNPDGHEVTLEEGYTITEGEPEPPDDEFRIDSVSPNSGREGDTFQIEIVGVGFGISSDEINIEISRTKVISIDFVSPTLIRATIWISCDISWYDLDLSVKRGWREVSLRDAITPIESQEGCPELRIDTVSPRSGKQGEDVQLEIVGDGFNPGTEIIPPQGIDVTVQFIDSQNLNAQINIFPSFPAPQEVYFIVATPGEEGAQRIRFYFDVEQAATTSPETTSGGGIPGFPYLAIVIGLIIAILLLDRFRY